MPLPLILWGVAAALAGTGVVKGINAKGTFDDAKRIGRRAETSHEDAEQHLQQVRNETNEKLQKLGKLKISIFNNQIKHLIDVIKKSKNASSRLSGFQQKISTDELKEMEKLVLKSLEIERGLGAGGATGALTALGAYGSVGALASASTGTAIAGLSGAAATNATLAWLGGGALSAGGFGMAGGAIALGGIVLGPALAIGGFMMASKAEEALTDATKYEAEVETAIAQMKSAETTLSGIQRNAVELGAILLEIAKRFDGIKTYSDSNKNSFDAMMALGKSLKELLDISIMTKSGKEEKNIKMKISGCLKI